MHAVRLQSIEEALGKLQQFMLKLRLNKEFSWNCNHFWNVIICYDVFYLNTVIAPNQFFLETPPRVGR